MSNCYHPVNNYRESDPDNTFVDRGNGKTYVRECKNCYHLNEPFKFDDNGPATCGITGRIPESGCVCDKHKRN